MAEMGGKRTVEWYVNVLLSTTYEAHKKTLKQLDQKAILESTYRAQQNILNGRIDS
jgi:hypothetical protein